MGVPRLRAAFTSTLPVVGSVTSEPLELPVSKVRTRRLTRRLPLNGFTQWNPTVRTVPRYWPKKVMARLSPGCTAK